jgi:hypothetical protein
MGFCSGTDIFDPVVGWILENLKDEALQLGAIRVLIIALEDHDWDCQDDSRWSNHPVVRRVMRELHPNWEGE